MNLQTKGSVICSTKIRNPTIYLASGHLTQYSGNPLNIMVTLLNKIEFKFPQLIEFPNQGECNLFTLKNPMFNYKNPLFITKILSILQAHKISKNEIQFSDFNSFLFFFIFSFSLFNDFYIIFIKSHFLFLIFLNFIKNIKFYMHKLIILEFFFIISGWIFGCRLEWDFVFY